MDSGTVSSSIVGVGTSDAWQKCAALCRLIVVVESVYRADQLLMLERLLKLT